MITLVVSGIGGPMLLLLSGCLVGSRVWWEWHWNWLLTSGDLLGSITSQGNTEHLWIHLPGRFAPLDRVRVDRQGITFVVRVIMVSSWSLSFGRVPRLIWAKAVSPIEHICAHKVLRSKAQCPTRLKSRIRDIRSYEHRSPRGSLAPYTTYEKE